MSDRLNNLIRYFETITESKNTNPTSRKSSAAGHASASTRKIKGNYLLDGTRVNALLT